MARAVAKANPKLPVAHHTLGAVLHRAAKHEEAVTELSEAVKLHPEGGLPVTYLFLAMAHHRLGQADEAKQYLDRAVKASEKNQPVVWMNRLEWQLLRREAEQLIQHKPPE
jgi:Flp pilus assembly protein TadD